MYELLRISREFYETCSSLRNFGKNFINLLLLILLLMLSMAASLVYGIKNKNFLVICLGPICQILGMYILDRLSYVHSVNTVKRINDILKTEYDPIQVDHAKFAYIKHVIIGVSGEIDLAVDKIDRIISIDKKNRISVGGATYLSKIASFAYSSESKNRIMSLVVYVFSLLAIIFVVKNDNKQEMIDVIFQALSYEFAGITFLLSLIVIVYLIIFVGFMYMIHDVIIAKLLLFLGHENYLVKNFIKNLCSYSFYDPGNFPVNDVLSRPPMEKVLENLRRIAQLFRVRGSR